MKNSSLDGHLVENPSIEERKQMVSSTANAFKWIPQAVSVSTIVMILVGMALDFLGFERGSSMYIVSIVVVGGAAGYVGFKLERAIETFFCLPAQILKEGKYKEEQAAFWFSLGCSVLMISLSLFLSLGGKNHAVDSQLVYNPTDITNEVKTLIAGFGMQGNDVSGKVSKCNEEVNTRYDNLIAESKKQAKTAKSEADRKWLAVGNVKALERKRGKELKACSTKYEKEFAATEKVSENASSVALALINKTKDDDKDRKEIITSKTNSYSFYLGYIILISLPLTILLYIVKVVNEKK